ncbi:MAG: hypothetical protein ACKOJ9_10720, partial [Actinomycetota bacterium]
MSKFRGSRLVVRGVAFAIVVSACSGGGSSSDESSPDTSANEPPTSAPIELSPAPPELVAAIEADISAAPLCDPIAPDLCLLPFPSDFYTVADDTPTGRRVAFPADGMPVNASGVAIDPTEWNRNDGFSPNSTLLASFTDLDGANLPTWTDLEASLGDVVTVVLIDESGRRIPLWAELDFGDDPLLVIHPAEVLADGASYTVGLRGLVDSAGAAIEASPAFVALRDSLDTGLPAIEERRDAMNAVFDSLVAAGVDRSELQLAWSFTVASTESLTSRILTVRDQTIDWLVENGGKYTITQVTPRSRDDVSVQVAGTFTSVNHMTGSGEPGERFNYTSDDPDALPQPNGEIEVPFLCQVPIIAETEPDRALRPGLYGHGLLGSEYEIDYGGDVRALGNEAEILFCSTQWAGMSEIDIGNAAETLTDFSRFPTMADRMQQGIVNFIALGWMMQNGLLGDPAFAGVEVAGDLVYYGNSQGGIMGSALAAVSPDISRSVLGVPGINYGLLLARSVDFDAYEAIMEPSYPSRRERTLILSFVQMLWDRGEGGGYMNHIGSDPLPGTREDKALLFHVALGDWQVTELSAYIAAEAVGATIHTPVVGDGRSREVSPGWGLEPAVDGQTGSAIVIWDSGSDLIPLGPEPPSTGRDPHEDPRDDAVPRSQMRSFLIDGEFVDVCGGEPCRAEQTG